MESVETSKQCQNCHQRYNKDSNREIILPCGDIICLECFQSLLQPQENKLICPFDKEEIAITQKFKDSITKLQETSKNDFIGINCSKHPNEQANIYCQRHGVLVCKSCVEDHFDHKYEFIEVSDDQIQDFFVRAFKDTEFVLSTLQCLMKSLNEYLTKKNNINSQSFTQILNQSTIVHNLKQQFENQNGKIQDIKSALQLQKQEEMMAEYQEQVMQIDYELDQKTINTFNLNKENLQLLQNWLGVGKLNLQLLYRGSRDSFTASTFHQKCDNQGPTLTLVKNKNDYIFGGFTTVPWTSAEGVSLQDDKAFIFSLTHREKHIPVNHLEQAVRHDRNRMVVFGNCEIRIDDECNEMEKNRTDYFGYVYSLPPGIEYRSIQAKQYLSGSDSYFRVVEIEVFKVHQ